MVVGLALVVVGIAVAVGFFVLGKNLKARVEAARSWSQVPAVVQESRLEKVGKSGWAPRVSYSYSVGGKPFESRRLQFGGVTMTKAEAEAVLAAYPAGATTTARYDPQNHAFSVLLLEADSRGYMVAGVGIGIAFGIAGLAVALSG